MEKFAIAGFGCAGYACAKALREAGFSGEIHVFSDGFEAPANPMLTTYYVAGKLPADGLYPFGDLQTIIGELRLTFHAGVAVTRLYAGEKRLVFSDGTEGRFDKILISTGAKPFVPLPAGYPEDAVYVMRTIADAERLRSRLEKKDVRKAVVIGASMVGIKIVELFSEMKIAPVLADAAERIFPLAALPEISREIQTRLDAKGVAQLYGSALKDVCRTESGIAVKLGDRSIAADLAVVCIGVRPRVSFVDPEELDARRGIAVDENMRTSFEGIYAAGDCAAGCNIQNGKKQVIGLWANAKNQGRAAGYHMAGRCREHQGEMLHNITHFMGMDFIGFGDVNAAGKRLSFREPDGSFRFEAILKEDSLACVNILDNHVISGAVKSFMTKRFLGDNAPVAPIQRAVLIRSGLPNAIIHELEG
jgi:3-phenylpropionate/trans-cinnamate dioxygenase ferredoxin reductase subunit